MTATKTNERPGTRAVLSSYRASAYKFREVLNLIRGRDVKTAREILSGVDRDVAGVIGKLLDSAIANAVNNDSIPADELYVASCFADEGPTMKRFRARARGRAGAIRKRTAHVTIVVARLEEDRLKIVRSKRDAEEANRRARRVARTRGSRAATATVAATQPVAVDAEESTTREQVVVDENVGTSPVEDIEVTGDPEVNVEAVSEGETPIESVDAEIVDDGPSAEVSEEEEK